MIFTYWLALNDNTFLVAAYGFENIHNSGPCRISEEDNNGLLYKRMTEQGEYWY